MQAAEDGGCSTRSSVGNVSEARALNESAIANHCESFFEADDNSARCFVFSALLGGIHVYVFPPSKKLQRDWYTLVTMGVSGTRMNVPPRIPQPHFFARCELMCYLPATWEFPQALGGGAAGSDSSSSDLSWPIDMLRSIGGYIVQNNGDVWFSYDHGIPNIIDPDHPGKPFTSSTKLSHVVTLEPVMEPMAFRRVACDGEYVNFLLCVPLTLEEALWKRAVGVARSIYHIVGNRRECDDLPIDYVIDPARKCAVKDLGWRERLEQPSSDVASSDNNRSPSGS